MNALFRLLPTRVTQALTAAYFHVQAWNSKEVNLGSVEKMSGMKIHVLPALQDNYMYLVVDETTKEALVVDPVEPNTVEARVREEGVRLSTVLTTHHHWDHAGGNEQIAKQIPNLTIIGGDDRIQALTRKVQHGDSFKLGNLNISCLYTPCHTTGHICYFITPETSTTGVVFTGDTLFLAGCGRFFEGTPDQMYSALVQKLGSLPDDTKVYCGHEYSVQNLKFARSVEPDNEAILEKLSWAEQQRAQGLPTVPSTIGEEKSYNPFMRVVQQKIQDKYGRLDDPIATMGSLRKMKDNWRG